MTKTHVALIYGGQNTEHEVSLISAQNVYKAIDKNFYDVSLIYVDPQGVWSPGDKNLFLKSYKKPTEFLQSEVSSQQTLTLPPGNAHSSLKTKHLLSHVDVVFPLIHGPMGEDGTLQGLLELMGVAYVGCGVLGSAVAMDKDFAKRLLRDAGIKTAKFEVCYSHDQVMPSYKDLTQLLGSPIIFVKPANMGSSVGISKVKCQESLQKALEDAFLYDHKVIIEEAIDGREIEVAALGNELVKISVAGEIIAEDKFYSYEAKYVNDNKAVLKAPVNLPTDIYENICKIAKRTFKTLGLRGMARIDFFLTSQGEIYVNEANTIPGFTSISMYPKLWEHSGLAYSDLIDELIKLAIKAHQHKQGLQKSFRGSLHAMVQSNP